MRTIIILVVWTVFGSACSRGDMPARVADTSTGDIKRSAAGSSSPPSPSVAVAVRDAPIITAAQVAQWRESSVPDKIDTLMAEAFSARGYYSTTGEEYWFSGSESEVAELRKIPAAIPRLVDCLGWDQRAAARYGGSRLLVGVVCYQSILGSEYSNKLNREGAFPLAAQVDFTANLSSDDVRKAQVEWRRVLANHPQ